MRPGPKSFRGGKQAKDAKGTMKRLMRYIVGPNKLRLAVVFLLLLISTAASVSASLFLKTLIDDYIAPLIGQAQPDFAPLLRILTVMACIYLAGILASFLQARLIIPVAQGTLKTIRDDMFSHMQTLPIRYFDTHTHGNVMSYYTNDTDTLRQMIGQSLPNAISSLISITAVFFAMMVIPRSRSRSPESITLSCTCSLALNTPLCLKRQSTNVVLPWSTWAIIATLRIFSFCIY